jgi:signal peptidase I
MNNVNNQNDPMKTKSFKDRLSQAKTKNWVKFILMVIFIIAFVVWTGYYLVFLLIPVFFDSYILKYIPWSFWKKSKNTSFRKFMEWADAIGFALVAVWVINTFFFQNYQIPSSSLEKSLLVGDFLFVSKMSYGTRSPMTPLSFPLAQHTLPVLDCKSYLDKPQVKYQRFAGFGSIERGNIVVFNFPAGDTVALNQQAADYYSLCKMDANGRAGLWSNKAQYGDIVYRPVDRRENYVKRCMGLPGETIQLIDDEVYINGDKVADPENMELQYFVQTDGTQISEKVFDELGVSKDDYTAYRVFEPLQEFRGANPLLNQGLEDTPERFTADSLQLTQIGFVAKGQNFGLVYTLPLTKKMVKSLKSKPFILNVFKIKERVETNYQLSNGKVLDAYPFYYPIDYKTGWTRDAYGPLWIPKKGTTITFDKDVDFKVAAYERAIKNYEGNSFDYRDGKVFINGKQADSYTFKFDYYFMMGDNRHNSADSRSWGFVPEDHIVGQPLFVWLSLDKDKGWFSGKIRWNRIFTSAKKK